MKQTRTSTQLPSDDGRTMTTTEMVETDLDQSFQHLGRPGNYRVMKGVEPLDRTDLNIAATLSGLVKFISVRKDAILERKHETHIKVAPKNSSITLTIGENSGFREEGGSYVPSTVVMGSSAFTEDRDIVAAIMASKHRPHDLALKLRELPHLFSDEAGWRDAVAKLRSLHIKISKAVKDTSDEDTGEREKAVKMVIESGAVEIAWTWRYSIYEGTAPMDVPVKVLYEADESMSGVFAQVFNPRKVQQERKALEDMLGGTILEIEKILGDAIPIVQTNG